MRRTMTTMTLAAALVASAAPATAAGDSGREVERTGSCSAGADWKLKAKDDDGRIEVEWEVDRNRTGQTWRVRVRDNGNRVIATRATTHGPSGSFSVERKVPNRAGSDKLVATARHLGGSQVCRGTLTF
jgi:hypothetical protein